MLLQERLDSSGKTRTTTSQILQVEVSLLHEGSPFFRAGQSYNIELELDMPESEVNYNAGTFMLSALYYDEVGMQTAVLVCGSGLMQLLIPTLYPYLSILVTWRHWQGDGVGIIRDLALAIDALDRLKDESFN